MNNTGYFQTSCKEDSYDGFFSVIANEELMSNDGWRFNAHRYLMAKHSSFFRDLFFQCKNDKNPTVIPNVRGVILEQVISFINTECILLNQENFTELMIAADYLQIDEMSRQLKIFSESILSVHNCLKIYVASVKICDMHLCELTYRIIQTNFHSLLDKYEANLMDIPVVFLKEIFSDNNLRVVGENVIWDFITKWVRMDPPNRFIEVFDFLKCLKIEDVEESLAKDIIGSDLISKNPYCENLKNIAFQKFPSNLDALRCIIDTCSKSSEIATSYFYSHRLPSCLHLIICYILDDRTEPLDIYVTYDEKIDIWRKLGEVKFESRWNGIHVIGSEVYAFDLRMNVHVFSLYETEWRGMGTMRDDDFYRAWSLTAKNKIYFISTQYIDDNSLKFECYNTENGLLSEGTLMHPVSNFEAVSFQDKIFVVGQVPSGPDLSMLAQVYEEDSNSWSVVTPPNIYRSGFSLISFHDKLYMIDGADADGIITGAVEVFDFERDEWDRIEDLPFVNEDSTTEFKKSALVLNDQLFVINRHTDEEEQYVLNETSKTWEAPEKPIYQYLEKFEISLIHTINDRKLIKSLVKESRHPSTSLKKSKF